MSEKAPHVPAAFINAIAEEGTKDEAIQYLQETWNDYREADAAAKRWYAAASPYATPEALREALSVRTEEQPNGWVKANHAAESLDRAIHALPGTQWDFWIRHEDDMYVHRHVLPSFTPPSPQQEKR